MLIPQNVSDAIDHLIRWKQSPLSTEQDKEAITLVLGFLKKLWDGELDQQEGEE